AVGGGSPAGMGCAGPIGLGFASPDGVARACGDCAGAPCCCPLRAPGISQGSPCHPIPASRPATNNTAIRHGRNPDFLRVPTVAVVSLRRGRRGGGSLDCTPGLATSASVGSLSTPPRGINFQPFAARQ